jgi:hypothetical protein
LDKKIEISKSAAVLIYIICAALQIPYLGFTVHTLWGWFVVPLGIAPILTWRGGLGIALLISTTSHQAFDDKRPRLEKAVTPLSWCVAYSITLAVGWLAKN